MTYRVLDLFSGIGGFSLGLERTGGFKTVAFCEIDPFCRRVLAKHWPGVPCYEDVCTLTADALARDGIGVDIICGGFPCQDVSHAGKRAGLEGARSGLWSEYARLIGELRPRFVIVENVPGLLSLGMGNVLGDLAEIGYDATWDCIPAAAVGAPHRRDRVWIVGHPQHDGSFGVRSHARTISGEQQGASEVGQFARASRDDPHAPPMQRLALIGSKPDGDHAGARDVADAHDTQRALQSQGREPDQRGRSGYSGGEVVLADANSTRLEKRNRSEARSERTRDAAALFSDWWDVEPDVGRVAHGVPARVDRLRSLGNAVVPQIPELIGRAILAAERAA